MNKTLRVESNGEVDNSNQDYEVNYTVDDDAQVTFRDDDDDTFDENDITPRDVNQVNNSASGLKHIDSAMLLANADRLSTNTTGSGQQGGNSAESSLLEEQEVTNQSVVTEAPLLKAKNVHSSSATTPSQSIMVQSKDISKEPHASPSRKP